MTPPTLLPQPQPASNMVHNERIKLPAGALSTTGIAVAITGTIAPMVGALYGTLATVPRWWLLLVASVCFFVGAELHLVAQAVLGRLRDG